VFEYFGAREAINLCSLALDGSRALAPFGRPLQDRMVELIAVTLNEESNGRKLWFQVVNQTQPKVNPIGYSAIADRVLFHEPNHGIDDFGICQVNEADVKHLLRRRVPVGDFLDNGLNGKAITKELEFLKGFLHRPVKAGEVVGCDMRRQAVRWHTWDVDQRSSSMGKVAPKIYQRSSKSTLGGRSRHHSGVSRNTLENRAILDYRTYRVREVLGCNRPGNCARNYGREPQFLAFSLLLLSTK
jgi:hypothetical protein